MVFWLESFFAIEIKKCTFTAFKFPYHANVTLQILHRNITLKYISYFFLSVEQMSCFRSSHQWCSVKKGVLRNFAKFAGKHLCQSLFFNKVETQKETLAQMFSCELCEISKNTFWQKTSGRLLLLFESKT